MSRTIIHLEVADFPIAVERVLEPRLKGRPVAVAVEAAGRALVVAASREAVANGVQRGMLLHQARRCCPELTVLPPNEDLYLRATEALLKILGQYSPIIEPLRFGHAYLDMTGCKIFGQALDAAARAQREIHSGLRLDANAGIAANKLVSKVATEVVTRQSAVPGLCDVHHGEEQTFLAPLRVDYLPAVQKTVYQQLRELNVHLIRELALISAEHLQLVFGRFGLLLYQHARGIDHRPVQPRRRTPEVVATETFAEDTNDYDRIRAVLFRLLSQATYRLRQMHLFARRLTVQVRYSDYKETQAQQSIPPAQEEWPLLAIAEKTLQHALTRRVRVRTITLRLTQLAAASAQLDLFAEPDHPKQAALTHAMDKIRQRFGEHAIGFGRAA